MFAVEFGRVLIGFGQREQFAFIIKIADECDSCGFATPCETIRNYNGGMASQIR